MACRCGPPPRQAGSIRSACISRRCAVRASHRNDRRAPQIVAETSMHESPPNLRARMHASLHTRMHARTHTHTHAHTNTHTDSSALVSGSGAVVRMHMRARSHTS
jgi:hypothetical protein